ncbi:enoyl-CoA hydratase/isomerase family protein [Tyzzerella sp. OttesenSCG-928-J15]|nr:enoyl-CoA hydratase/isomerase family protein [Tyzzerella sp. OttesenSCG-928-J15]
MGYILYEEHEHIGRLTINRPEAMNALNTAMLNELGHNLIDIAKSSIRCLLVTGAGEKSFVAGADISEMVNLTSSEAKKFSEAGNAVLEQLENLLMPTIAVINGYALGGGCELALACDLRIASDTAVFGFPETSLGILPGYGGIQRLVRALGLSKAKMMVFSCGRISADEALRNGLIDKVVPKQDLIDQSYEIAKKIACNAPHAVSMSKSIANNSIGLTSKESIRLEGSSFGSCFETEDQLLAMQAFIEKRKPLPFTGKLKER